MFRKIVKLAGRGDGADGAGDATDPAGCGVCGGDALAAASASRDRIWKTMGRTRAVSRILEPEIGNCGADASWCWE